MSLPTDPAENLAALIRCPSVTPAEGGALTALEAMLAPMGFSIERPTFSRRRHARRREPLRAASGNGPHLMFAGHTDVVPVGDEAAWTHPPFSAAVANGQMYGRGAVDMKGGIACFVAAVARHIEETRRPEGLGLAADHRRRGRPVDQRHRQAARMGGSAWRDLGRGDRRRADQSGRARRHDQDRPARLDLRHRHRAWPAGPCRLSASRRQSGARDDDAARRAAGAGLRRRDRRFPADQSGDHLGRCRQSGGQRHSGQGDGRLQHPLQRQLDGRDACRPRSTTGSTAPRASANTARAARSRSRSTSPGATGRAMSS